MVRLTPEQVNQIVATNTSVGVVALELELRAVMDERDAAKATLAAIRAWADKNLPYAMGQNTVELRALNHGYATARLKVLALLDAAPKETP